MGTRIDGKKVAARTKADLAKRVELLKAQGNPTWVGYHFGRIRPRLREICRRQSMPIAPKSA